MGYKHRNEESLPIFELDRHVKILEAAQKKAEELKAADKKRLANIKERWFAHEKLSEVDTEWLIMNMEKALYKWRD